jgi:hypothetical protein
MMEYQPHPGYYPPPQQLPPMRNGLGTAALVLGIVGAVVALIPIIGFIGFICGLVGVCLGIAGINRASKGRADNRTTAIIGTILSVLAVIISIVIWTSFVNAVNDAGAPNAVAPAAPPEPGQAPAAQQSDFEAGQAADVEGLVIQAGPLQKIRQQFGDPVVCSDVAYENRSDDTRSYNGGFDWKLQDPNNNIVMTTFASDVNRLPSGELAPGGKVAGKACFKDPKLKGEYWIINDELVSFSSTPVRWKTTL